MATNPHLLDRPLHNSTLGLQSRIENPKLSVTAVLVGTAIDFAFIVVIGFALLFAGGLDPQAFSLPPEELQAAMLEVGRGSWKLTSIGIVLGTAGTVAAGYVAGRVAGRSGAFHGVAASLLGTGINAYGIMTGVSVLPLWLALLLLPLGPLAGAFGGARARTRATEA